MAELRGQRDVRLSHEVEELGEWLSDFLRDRYPSNTVAEVARDLESVGCKVDERTIRGWKDNKNFPTKPSTIAALHLAYGQELVDALWVPLVVSPAEAARLLAERHEREAARWRAEAAVIEAQAARDPRRSKTEGSTEP